MVRKQRKRISYVLPLANSTSGHRLGVNGLAVDPQQSILYSGGRDGVVCAWDLNLNLSPFGDDDDDDLATPLDASGSTSNKASRPTSFRQKVQAHTHWINDLQLVQNNEALVSASSDITVKVWRPAARDGSKPQTIGLHSDYVKCLAYPGQHAGWIASGGLDRKIYLWDLNGMGEQLRFNVGEEENTAKGSVYALAATQSLLASGGPESIIRVWDLRSARQVTKLVGHTDNIRDVLISQDGETVMTASADQTVKVWSLSAGRCMYTLTMHNDSVWSLFSDHPRLSIFYSSDRCGLVAKTDTRGCAELDEGVSVAVCQEHEGVSKIVNAGDYLWTATSSSSINRWRDVDTDADIHAAAQNNYRRGSVATTRSRQPSPPPVPRNLSTSSGMSASIPGRSLLRMSNAAPFRIQRHKDSEAISMMSRRASEVVELSGTDDRTEPMRNTPDYTIEGQHGLIKHVMLNDKRSVLTVDTAGDVIMWDLLKCIPVKSFGKRHLDDVVAEVNTTETVPYWCSVDTRTGSLTCILEENNCFDAEMYADEIHDDAQIDFREDQRINLGKWILRYLFSQLIDEEIRRDEIFRKQLMDGKQSSVERPNAPFSIQIPGRPQVPFQTAEPTSASTLRPTNGFHMVMPTPGLAIGLATPGLPLQTTAEEVPPLPPLPGAGAALQRTHTQGGASQSQQSNDYFSQPFTSTSSTLANGAQAGLQASASTDQLPQSPATETSETPAQEKAEKGLFGKKFRMNFNMKGLTKSKPVDVAATKPAETTSEDGDSRNSKTEERLIEDNFLGVLQKMRIDYQEQVILMRRDDDRGSGRDADGRSSSLKLSSAISPSLPSDTPVLKLPLNTIILIQEDRVDSGGVADLFEGIVGSLGERNNADDIERVAPTWLAECLLKNHVPHKEIVKISFVLEPFGNLLPNIASDGESNTRLNANRMLRAKKIMAYVAERIEPLPEKPEPGSLKPEEYLELYCQGQLIHPTMTLATIRAHVWRGGGDVVLMYKANGRKPIRSHYHAHRQGSTSHMSAASNSPGASGRAPSTPGTAMNTAPMRSNTAGSAFSPPTSSSGAGGGGGASAPPLAHHTHSYAHAHAQAQAQQAQAQAMGPGARKTSFGSHRSQGSGDYRRSEDRR